MRRLGSVLVWSILAAAFIGPGTVTTAASAGASYGYSLLWALSFSTIACLVMQEAAARLTVVSGRDLGQALRVRYPAGVAGLAVVWLVLGAIVLGCAAYEAGNIFGGVAGALLVIDLSRATLTLVSAFFAAALLLLGAPRTVARLLAVLVALMGLAFLVTGVGLGPSLPAILRAAALPSLPAGSGLVVLGLVGTTVVPYNLFLGSGLARGQELRELRFGLTVAVLLGGAISMGIVVVGAAIEGRFDFETLASVLDGRLGGRGRLLLATGLFAAGLSSAVTAPLAAAVTARSLFAPRNARGWEDRSWRFRAVWLGVLAVGVGFGLAEVRPIPAILVAQALNGVLLPFVAVFLLLAVNDRRLMGRRRLNGALANTILALAVAATMVLGLSNVARAAAVALHLSQPSGGALFLASAAVAAILAWPIGRSAARHR